MLISCPKLDDEGIDMQRRKNAILFILQHIIFILQNTKTNTKSEDEIQAVLNRIETD